MMKLWTSFIDPYRATVKYLSIQRSNRGVGLSGLRHLDKCDTARLTRVSIDDNCDGFNGSSWRKDISQLLFGHRNVEVPDKNIGHESISAADPKATGN
jgi:hypothetical protein